MATTLTRPVEVAAPALGQLRVRVRPDSHEQHVLQIYAGLFDLHAEGQLALQLTPKLVSRSREFAPHTLWMELDHPAEDRVVTVCFDMADGGRIATHDGLERCDAYFKRSFSPSVVNDLPAHLARKVAPYGMNYACLANRPRTPGKHVWAGLLVRNGRRTWPGWDPQGLKQTLRLTLTHRVLRGTRFAPFLRARDFESPPDTPAAATVLFQTRLYEGQGELNGERIGIVRALRDAFGTRFCGGLESNAVALREAPELITPMSSRKGDYVRLVRRHLVAVTSRGLWDSIGWKLPEYFAASRAIVCEPLRYELPAPLVPGEHYIPVHSLEGLVTACDRILTDPALARDLREGAWAYYRENIEPSALMRRCLQVALRVTSPSVPAALPLPQGGEAERLPQPSEALVLR